MQVSSAIQNQDFTVIEDYITGGIRLQYLFIWPYLQKNSLQLSFFGKFQINCLYRRTQIFLQMFG